MGVRGGHVRECVFPQLPRPRLRRSDLRRGWFKRLSERRGGDVRGAQPRVPGMGCAEVTALNKRTCVPILVLVRL